jgi:hypothetical protein
MPGSPRDHCAWCHAGRLLAGNAMTPKKIERNFEACGLKLSKEATKLIMALCEYSAREERERCAQAYDNLRAENATLVEEVERWKAIAQAHNDSLVERIAENERLKRNWQTETGEHTKTVAENERRLREALESVRNMPFTNPDELRSIARAALNRVEESAPSAESATYNERWKSKP